MNKTNSVVCNISNILNKDNRADTLTNRMLSKFKQSNISATIENLLVEIPLTSLKDNGNTVRPSGEHVDIVTEIVELIENDEYDPYRYIPPIVEHSEVNKDCYTIISGHHRFKAHNALKLPTMECAVLKFKSERDRSLWRQLENTASFDGYIKNVTSEEDNIKIVSDVVNRGVIKSDRAPIQAYIIDANMVTKKAEKTINRLINAVLKKTGNDKTYDYVRTWDKEEKYAVIEVLKNKLPDTTFLPITFNATNGEDHDFDHRVMVKVIESFLKDPTRPIVIVYSVNGNTADNIKKIREFKPGYIVPNFLDPWTKVIELQNNGFDLNKLVTLEYLPQIGVEMQTTNNGVDNFISRLETKYSNTDAVVEKLMEAMTAANGNDRKALKEQIKKIMSGDRDPQEVIQ